VAGTPNVIISGTPNFGGTIDGNGDPAPADYTVTLSGGISLGQVARRTDPVPLPLINAPLPPSGTRSVTINNPDQSVGDWNTVRDLTINKNGGPIVVPPGAYGSFGANGGAASSSAWPAPSRPRFTISGA